MRALEYWLPMDLSKVIAAVALALAAVLVSEYSRAAEKVVAQQPVKTQQPLQARETVEAREAARRLALVDHQRRKDNVVRLCGKPLMTQAELEACRVAYRRL
jgi:hypothetical protein